MDGTRHGAGTRTVGAAGALLLLLLLGTAACGSQVAGGGGSQPPVLRIGDAGGAAMPAAAGSGAGPGPGSSGQDPYPLEGTLPTGSATAVVLRYDEGPFPAAEVHALATALGIAASPVRHPVGWVSATAAGTLRVRDGAGAWSYARGSSECPAYSVDVDHADGAAAGMGCVVASPQGPGSPTPAPRPTAPSDAAALAAARPVLAAAGLDPSAARVLPGADGLGTRWVVVDPVVGGRPTAGARTTVDVDADGTAAATGFLGTPHPGDAYPIVTAAAALDLLRDRPQPEIAVACPIGRTCPGIGPHVVTGARLGLTLAYDAGTPVLVPAWLFTVRGSADPVPVVAVEARYLGDAAPGPAPTGGSGSVPGATGGAGTGPAPVPPVPALPVPAPTIPVAHPVNRVTVSHDGLVLTLQTVGGVCAAYTGHAVETSTTVTVSVTSTPTVATDRACPAIARAVDVTVRLDAPLGARHVIDGTTGREVVPG